MADNNNYKRPLFVDGTLPWDNIPGERRRQIIAAIIILLLLLLFLFMLAITDLPQKDRRQVEELPDRIAKMVMEQKKEEPPPPPPPPPEEQPEPEEKKPEETKKDDKPKPPPEKVEQARQKAKKELQVFQDSLAGLSDFAPVVSPSQNLRKGGSEATTVDPTRNLITSRAGKGSGGISVGSVSSGGGGGGTLTAGTVTQVESGLAGAPEAVGGTRKTADGKSRRTEEQIRLVFNRYAGRINSAYQRQLRQNPALQGTVVLTLEVAPSGAVTDASIKSSELNDPDLERKILVIVKSMDFGALNVEIWKGDYPINFFPS